MADQQSKQTGDDTQRPSPWGAYAGAGNNDAPAGASSFGGVPTQRSGTAPPSWSAQAAPIAEPAQPAQPTTRLGAMGAGGAQTKQADFLALFRQLFGM